MPNINITLGSFGITALNYTLRYKVTGTSTWITSGTIPTNPIATSNLNPVISNVLANTFYDIQVVTNCGSSTAQSSVLKKVERDCPTLLSYNTATTDSSITISYPLATPSPISSHVSSILVELYQGLSLITSQTISTPNTTNTITFSGLNQNTTYTVKHILTYAYSDSIPEASYPNGATSNTSICSVNVLTDVTPICQTPIVISITQS